jgi:hypothetical protein
MGLAQALGDCEKIEIVVAEHGHRPLAQAARVTQRLERLRPAVHEIADEPKRVVRGIEGNRVEQPAQLVVTALDVADGVSAHRGCGFM